MTVTVRCPGCRQPYRVGGSQLDRRARCQRCGMTFTLELSVDGLGRTKGMRGISRPSSDTPSTPPQRRSNQPPILRRWGIRNHSDGGAKSLAVMRSARTLGAGGWELSTWPTTRTWTAWLPSRCFRPSWPATTSGGNASARSPFGGETAPRQRSDCLRRRRGERHGVHRHGIC